MALKRKEVVFVETSEKGASEIVGHGRPRPRKALSHYGDQECSALESVVPPLNVLSFRIEASIRTLGFDVLRLVVEENLRMNAVNLKKDLAILLELKNRNEFDRK
ncbi:hypothetical protein Trydic_g4958 [Trypoxylus dichotomus]